MEFIWTVIAIFSLWLLILTFVFFRLSTHYNRLIKGANNKSLQSLLESLLKETDITKKDIAFLKDRCDTIDKDGKLHIQKIGLLRFNPFKDTGGDQSFILALVDNSDTGVVISGLYSRSGTRWYAKTIKNGKGVEHELSDEEKKALHEANKGMK
ncbi:MAG TPA: DUF4446 family protein [Patescibacteria group bacterium]